MARILLINDEPDLLAMCQLILESAGHAVFRALNPRDALRRAAAERPDAVLLDLVMPAMSGEEVLKRLRESPSTTDIPVVIMSALPDAEQRAAELGVAGFVAKPFDPDALTEAMSKALANGHRGERSARASSEAR
jgi:CheY-like chemotaxis protein